MIENIGYHAHLKENEHLFRYRAKLEGSLFRCVCYGLNLLPVQIFLNWFIFFKLVHIFQTGSYFSNWVEIFKPVLIFNFEQNVSMCLSNLG